MYKRQRITSYYNTLSATDPLQSAYRRNHSCETALLRVTNDIFEAVDAGESVLLVALDQSAAFDCIDHHTLLDRLQHTYGLVGSVLDWLRSYLDSRRAFVKWRSYSSDCIAVDTGVPQGSSLGPQLFSMYIAPLARLIKSFGVRYHQYADDSQLYIAISRTNQNIQLATLEQCLSRVHEWLLHNGLSLNPTKSEAVQFANGWGRRCGGPVESISVSGVAIHAPSWFCQESRGHT